MAFLTRFVTRIMPPSLIRFLGRLQFRFPILKTPINFVAQYVVSRGPGMISHGCGKGLMFNAKGCNPGFLTGTSEPFEQQLVSEFLSEGDVFYDVGANAGYYAVIAARRVGNAGKVYAFEPTPTLARRIQENADLNSFAQIEVVESAVGDTDGYVKFAVHSELGVQNAIANGGELKDYVRVACTTLNEFAKANRPPKLILMDIEGAELDAIIHAMDVISTYRPTLMIEVHWLGAPFIDFVESRLLPLGYVATTYSGDELPRDGSRYHCLLQPKTD